MYMEYKAEILRGWPADGARDRVEMVKQGSVLVNGDVVAAQVDGTVDKVGATASKYVGLVIRGNGDSASGANAQGRFMTPQPAQAITAMTWSGGILSVTVTGHGYVAGNTVAIAGGTYTGTSANGTFTILAITNANVFTVALATTCGTPTLTSATATQGSAIGASGEAVVLWGNYIVKTQNYAAGSYVPGSPVTCANGMFALATPASGTGSTYAPGDPIVGHVLRVQGTVVPSGSPSLPAQTAHLVINVA